MRRVIVLAALASMPLAALSEEPRYTYVEGGYQALDLDNVDADGDGFGIGGSLALTERVFVTAAYSNMDLDFGIDVSSYDLSVGGNIPLSDGLHLVGEVGYTWTEFDTSIFDVNDDGYFVSGGFRWMATPALELDAGLNYVDLDDSGDDTSLSVGALYSVTDSLALGAGIEWGDDATGYSLGLRYYFPGRN